MAKKTGRHIVHLTSYQFDQLALNKELVLDNHGSFYSSNCELYGESVGLLHNIDDDTYYAYVPRCMMASKILKYLERMPKDRTADELQKAQQLNADNLPDADFGF